MCLFMSMTFIQCTNSDEVEISYLDELPSNIFTDLVRSDIAPFNKLSEATVIEFNNKLVFTEDGEMIGGDHSQVELELTAEELQTFFNYLFDKEVRLVDELPKESKTDGIQSRDCIIWVVSGLYPIAPIPGYCVPGMGYCGICIYVNNDL